MNVTRTSASPWGAALGVAAMAAAVAVLVTAVAGAQPARRPALTVASADADADADAAAVGVTPAPAGTPSASIVAVMGSGYVESEWFLTGTASSYRPAGTWGSDGRWGKVVDEADQPFTTRLLVDRPADPARFNGTVWVEWLNVTAGTDAAASVIQARDHITASGAAWVGVSAQATGVNAMRQANPGRYGQLSVASDAFGYDVFTRAGEAVRDHPEVLGGVPARRLIAVGDSQSALRLTTYVNAWTEAHAYDGVIIHSRFTSGAPANDESLIMGTTPTRIRDDVAQPVFQLQTEAEVALDLEWLQPGLGAWADVRQPNAGNVHTWEVAGATHADKYLLSAAGTNTGLDISGLMALLCLSPSVNSFPFHYAANAAFAAQERWVADGTRPPDTPPIETVDGVIQRDTDGNARGGLRLPDIDVPIAHYEGGTNPNILCALFGSTTPFSRATLRARYGSTAAYVAAYRQRADSAVAAGIMTAADRDAAVRAAESVQI